jgi:predicted transcriptional regulator
MRIKTKRVLNDILAYLATHPGSGAAQVQKGIGLKVGNIYGHMKLLLDRGAVVREGMGYSLSESGAKAMSIAKIKKPEVAPQSTRFPLRHETKSFSPSPLINIIQREIQYIEDGIDSLMITKNYLQRRIEQLKLEDAKRARAD